MNNITKKVEPTNEVCIKFSEEEMEQLKLQPGTKLSVKELDNGSLELAPFASLEVDMADWSREMLEMLVKLSCDQDVSVNEVIQKILSERLDSAQWS